jgi:hypothetical protein
MDVFNTMVGKWMMPPEFLKPDRFGKIGKQMDIYHAGMLRIARRRPSTSGRTSPQRATSDKLREYLLYPARPRVDGNPTIQAAMNTIL